MELMKELSLAPGVSGSEKEIAKIITRELENVADKIEKDSMGNLIATKKGEKKQYLTIEMTFDKPKGIFPFVF